MILKCTTDLETGKFIHKIKPTNLTESPMFLDVEYSVLLVSEPLCRIVSAEPLDERDGSLGDVTRELDVVDAAQDDVVDLHRVACGKRRAESEWMFF